MHGEKTVIVDDEDYDRVKNYTWHVNKYGYVRTNIKVKDFIDRKTTISIHRLIMDYPKDKIIDHVNHNPLDNRKCNLRICTDKENLKNYSKPKDGMGTR